MRILLDTNIFIPLEDSAIDIDSTLTELNRITSGNHHLLVHPGTEQDLSRDKNDVRRKKILARLGKYLCLESPPIFQENEEAELFGVPRKDNDHIDNLILLAVHKNCVHWLITNDEGLHKKAKKIGEQERVLTVEQALSTLSKMEKEDLTLYPSIENVLCHTLDLKNPFFDSLRDSYFDFDKWFKEKCAQDGRKAWICTSGINIDAICIYKLEKDSIVTTEKKGLLGNILKLCTFKVLKRGFKIGELLLKQAFIYAVENRIDHTYLTIEPDKHGLLEELLLDFGFYVYGKDVEGRDNVFVKDFPKHFPINSDTPLEYAVKYFPLIKITSNCAYIVPIKPKYHEVLFPEIKNKIQFDLFENEPTSAGNTIKKAYLCNARTATIKAGDILFFYRTEDHKAITSYGVVDQFYIENDPEMILQWVSKRTVYSNNEIQTMKGKSVKIILFRLVGHLESPIEFNKLKQLNIVSGAIQSITKINNPNIKNIINEAKLDDRILSN